MCFVCTDCGKYICSWPSKTKKDSKKHYRGKSYDEHRQNTAFINGRCNQCVDVSDNDEKDYDERTLILRHLGNETSGDS